MVLSSGAAGARIEAQRLAVAVVRGVLLPPQGTLPQLGGKDLLAGERLLVDPAGQVEGITLGSLNGDSQQAGDVLAFANLPPAVNVERRFARFDGAVARLAGAPKAQGMEIAPSGVVVVRDAGQVLQLLPTLPITIDATLPDAFTFTPLGLLR